MRGVEPAALQGPPAGREVGCSLPVTASPVERGDTPTQQAPVGAAPPCCASPSLHSPLPPSRSQSCGAPASEGALRVWPSMCSNSSEPPKLGGGATPYCQGGFQGGGGWDVHGRPGRAWAEMLGKEGAAEGRPSPALPCPPAQGSSTPEPAPLTHGQSRWAHGARVAGLPWSSLQRKVDMVGPLPFLFPFPGKRVAQTRMPGAAIRQAPAQAGHHQGPFPRGPGSLGLDCHRDPGS